MSASSQYGVDELVAPENAKVDIIFVHGLSGNRRETWTSNGILWPKTLLPTKIPRARILTFGYEAEVVDWNHAVTQSTMETHASDLGDRVAGLRANTASSKRPIVFVAHSLGGLVCAQLIVKGGTAVASDNVRIVADCCTGIVFLGTPFHGSPSAKYFEILRQIASVFRDTNSAKIQDLNEKSQKLAILVENFTSRLHQRLVNGTPVELQFFYETLKTNGVLVVPEASARLLGYESHASILANHRNMCKFSDVNDEGYKSVSSVIQKFSELELKSPRSLNSGHSTVFNNYDNTKVGQQIGEQSVYGGQHFH